MPEPVFHVERVVCQLPDKWRMIIRAEWIFRWPHWYAARRMHMSRPTHLANRKHAYGVVAAQLAHVSEYAYAEYRANPDSVVQAQSNIL
jgi:hypothetical protein